MYALCITHTHPPPPAPRPRPTPPPFYFIFISFQSLSSERTPISASVVPQCGETPSKLSTGKISTSKLGTSRACACASDQERVEGGGGADRQRHTDRQTQRENYKRVIIITRVKESDSRMDNNIMFNKIKIK